MGTDEPQAGDGLPSDADLADLLGSDFGGDLVETVIDGETVLVDLSSFERKFYGPPPPVDAVPVVDVPSVYGRRLVHMRPEGPVYDLRAVSEVFTDSSGSYVMQVREWQWYAWLNQPDSERTPRCPKAVALPALNVWVEQYPPRREQL